MQLSSFVMAQGQTDYLLPTLRQEHPDHGEMMVICASEEAIYITKAQAMEFFNLVPKE